MKTKEGLKPKEAALYMGVSERMLRQWRFTGEGPDFIPAGHRTVIYRLEDIEAWFQARKVKSTSDRPNLRR